MADGPWGEGENQRIFKIKISWQAALQKCQTGFYLRDVGLQNLGPQDAVDAVVPWVNTMFKGTLHSSDIITSVDAENIVTREGRSHEFTNLVGGGLGQRCPTFLMVPVALKGPFRRRYGQGRMLWPVSTEDYIDGQGIGVNGRDAYTAIAADLAERFIGSTLTTDLHLVNVHKEIVRNPIGENIAPHWYDVTSLRVNTLLSSVKRRKVGIGS